MEGGGRELFIRACIFVTVFSLHDRKLRAEEDLRIVRQTYDASRAEYQLVMSERDTVLKENQELSEEKENLLDKLQKEEEKVQATDEELKALKAHQIVQVHIYLNQTVSGEGGRAGHPVRLKLG